VIIPEIHVIDDDNEGDSNAGNLDVVLEDDDDNEDLKMEVKVPMSCPLTPLGGMSSNSPGVLQDPVPVEEQEDHATPISRARVISKQRKVPLKKRAVNSKDNDSDTVGSEESQSSSGSDSNDDGSDDDDASIDAAARNL